MLRERSHPAPCIQDCHFQGYPLSLRRIDDMGHGQSTNFLGFQGQGPTSIASDSPVRSGQVSSLFLNPAGYITREIARRSIRMTIKTNVLFRTQIISRFILGYITQPLRYGLSSRSRFTAPEPQEITHLGIQSSNTYLRCRIHIHSTRCLLHLNYTTKFPRDFHPFRIHPSMHRPLHRDGKKSCYT
jgi:hypothetical protein